MKHVIYTQKIKGNLSASIAQLEDMVNTHLVRVAEHDQLTRVLAQSQEDIDKFNIGVKALERDLQAIYQWGTEEDEGH